MTTRVRHKEAQETQEAQEAEGILRSNIRTDFCLLCLLCLFVFCFWRLFVALEGFK